MGRTKRPKATAPEDEVTVGSFVMDIQELYLIASSYTRKETDLLSSYFTLLPFSNVSQVYPFSFHPD